MKKKITALFLCVALAAIAIVGASLAYFTDTDNETNTFAVGNVKIDLIEQERGKNGLQPFTQGKLTPSMSRPAPTKPTPSAKPQRQHGTP